MSYRERKKSDVIHHLEQLINDVQKINSSYTKKALQWTVSSAQELEVIKANYLSSKISFDEFKTQSLKTVETHFTRKNLKQLSNYSNDATFIGNLLRHVGNFFRAIVREAKHPLEPQFHALKNEIEFYRTMEALKEHLDPTNNYKRRIDMMKEKGQNLGSEQLNTEEDGAEPCGNYS